MRLDAEILQKRNEKMVRTWVGHIFYILIFKALATKFENQKKEYERQVMQNIKTRKLQTAWKRYIHKKGEDMSERET